MGEFSKIGLRVGLSDEKMMAWLKRMSPEGMEKEPLRVSDVGEMWGSGIEAWQVGRSFLSGTIQSQALGGMFMDEGGMDLEEKELREALEGRLRFVEGGLSLLRATMRGLERSAGAEMKGKFHEIGELMDKALPDGLKEVVVAASEAALAEVGTEKAARGKPRTGL